MSEYQKLPGQPTYAVPYLAEVVEWGVREPAKDSQAVSVFLRMHLLKSWDAMNKKWDDMEGELSKYELIGDWYTHKKDGSVNQNAVEQLHRSIGWNGDWTFYERDPLEGLAVSVVVETEVDAYEGKNRIKATWLNPPSHIPGSQGIARKMPVEKLSQMNSLRPLKGLVPEKPPVP